jgi:hypothetical protein
MNQFIQLPSESREARLAQVEPLETAYDGGGWAGDGSGTDDLADYNANEADSYRDEGAEDAGLDSYWEAQTDLGDMGE